jgi:hypothetical protein
VDQKFEKDYAMFLQDIEEDPELRGQIDLYKVIIFYLIDILLERGSYQ